MSSLAVHACDDMAPISRQPEVLLVPFKLAGDTEVRRNTFLYYSLVSKCAGVHLQGASRIFRISRIIRVDRALA